MSFMWPRHRYIPCIGLAERIQARLVSLGGDGMVERCNAAFDELSRQERTETFMAIRGGETYQTLWQRAG